MQVELFDVAARGKAIEAMYPARDDFTLTQGTVADGRLVIGEPGWSPYCLDAARQEVVFVHRPGGIDLSEAAFVGVTQFREADRVLCLPFAEVEGFAAHLRMPKVIWIFSIGRAGSTLVSHALNGPDNVWSLSEPGVFDPRGLRAGGAALIVPLLKLLFAAAPAGRDTLAVKLRSQSSYQIPIFFEATPDARYVYLYRNAVGWAGSISNMLQGFGLPAERLDGEMLAFHWAMTSADQPLERLGEHVDLSSPVPLEVVSAVGWAMHADAYRRQVEAGVPFLALSYDQFAADPRGTTARLLEHCELPAAGLERALAAFERDSQAGTVLARDPTRKKLTEAQVATMLRKLAALGYPDPATVMPDIYGSRRPG